MSTSHNLPPYLDVHNCDLADTYKRWERMLLIYMKASGATNKPKDVQVAIILNCAGPDAVELYDNFAFTNEQDGDDPKVVLKKLRDYCTPRINETLESYRFWNIKYCEPFDSFVTELRKQGARCNFVDIDRMLRDKIAFTVPQRLQEELLKEPQLTIVRTLELCRNLEILQKNKREMTTLTDSANTSQNRHQYVDAKEANSDGKYGRGLMPRICRVKNELKYQHNEPSHSEHDQRYGESMSRRKHGMYRPRILDCRFCGQRHIAAKSKCPAWGKHCRLCGRLNHFSCTCRTSVNQVSRECDGYHSGEYECSESYGSDDDEWYKEQQYTPNTMIRQVTRGVTTHGAVSQHNDSSPACVRLNLHRFSRKNHMYNTPLKEKGNGDMKVDTLQVQYIPTESHTTVSTKQERLCDRNDHNRYRHTRLCKDQTCSKYQPDETTVLPLYRHVQKNNQSTRSCRSTLVPTVHDSYSVTDNPNYVIGYL